MSFFMWIASMASHSRRGGRDPWEGNTDTGNPVTKPDFERNRVRVSISLSLPFRNPVRNPARFAMDLLRPGTYQPWRYKGPCLRRQKVAQLYCHRAGRLLHPRLQIGRVPPAPG